MARSRKNPVWIPPFLGRVPEDLPPEPLRVLGVVALALLFEEYDTAMLTSAIKHIADDLPIADDRLGLDMALIRLGAVPAVLLSPLADRVGRRPVFIGSAVALALLTFATAFVTSELWFVALQAACRAFFVTSTAVGFVIVTEELPAQHRGWGTGMLAALGAMGHGLGAALFSQIERLPYGWRSLYVVGVLPALCLPLFLRAVPETARFSASVHARERAGLLHAVLGPLRALFAASRLRALGVSVSGMLVAAAAMPVFQFTSIFTQKKLAWTPGQFSMMVILAGALGIVGNVAAGRLGDAFGRKKVGAIMLGAVPLAAFGFYNGRGPLVVASFIPLVFCSMGAEVILRALAAELFPTSHRSAAIGLYSVAQAVGAVGGLLLVHAFGTTDVDALARVVPMVALSSLGAAVPLVFFPETRHRELEELSRGY